MIKMKISAVTGVTYGLLSALVIVVSLAALTVAGVGVENVFSLTGNTIASTIGVSGAIGSPNPNLNSEQQSEITNAAAEIAAGTASVACLQQMNNAANAASMAINGATCLGPGYGISPPNVPVKSAIVNGYAVLFAQNGAIYSAAFNGSFMMYNDGYAINQETSATNYTNTIYEGFHNGNYMYTGHYIGQSGDTDGFSLTNQTPASPLGYFTNYSW